MSGNASDASLCRDGSHISPLPTSPVDWKEFVAEARRKMEYFHQEECTPSDIEEWIQSPLDQQCNMAIESLSASCCLTSTANVSKQDLVTVRMVLRFLVVTLGVPERHRTALQRKLCQSRLLHCLGKIILTLKQDVKSRVTACRLMTNLVTGNEGTSRFVLNHFPWQPPPLEGANRPNNTSWLDLLLAANSVNRDALAAMVVCCYNALQAIPGPTPDQCAAEKRMVRASLVISNLLRNLMPSTLVLSLQKQQDGLGLPAPDEATEWITLLLCHLCRTCSFSRLYTSATGHETPLDDYSSTSPQYVLPEHVLLLQVLLSHSEENHSHDNAAHLFGFTQESQEENVAFLANTLYGEIRSSIYPFLDNGGLTVSKERATVGTNEMHKTSQSLAPTALCLIREILAEVLVHDTPASQHLRKVLANNGTFGTALLDELAYHYDSVQFRFQGRPAKDVVLTEQEKRIFVSIVRLLGNLSYQCRPGQDRLRETLVPQRDQNPGDGSHSGGGNADATETGATRTGLHLLLSCTSLSHTCFTLREWSVIAIRNALHENTANQALVAELQAQQPAPSAALDEMGVRVQLETNGKVSLTPIVEETHKTSSPC